MDQPIRVQQSQGISHGVAIEFPLRYFSVKNTGSREGAEVTELYVGDSHASVPRPVRELKGFAKVLLKPGETKSVTISLDQRAFSYYDVSTGAWRAEPGDFSILVGGSSSQIELLGSLTLK